MRASPLILRLAIATGLAACQPAQQADSASPDPVAAGNETPPPAAAPMRAVQAVQAVRVVRAAVTRLYY